MAKWFFEPGHTSAECCARHMMVSCVRGHFKNVHGTLQFDEANPSSGSVEVAIDARGLWGGEPDRDAQLRRADVRAGSPRRRRGLASFGTQLFPEGGS